MHVAPVDTYQAPINHAWAADQGWGIDEILAATGREYSPSNYLIPLDDAELARDIQMVGLACRAWLIPWWVEAGSVIA